MKDNNTFLALSVIVVVAVLAYLIVDLDDFIPKKASGSLVEGIENRLHDQKHETVLDEDDLKVLLEDENFRSIMSDENFKIMVRSPAFIELAKNPDFQAIMKKDTFWEVIENHEFTDIDSIFFSE